MRLSASIVIVSWDRREDSLRCLLSLRRLATPGAEIIFVDNGSTDGTREMVRRQFPEVELISSKKNLGFTGGNNLGIRRALEKNSAYICLLNNDTVVDPRFLDELLRAAGGWPRAGIIGPRIYFHDRPGRIWSQGISVHPRSGRIYTSFYNRPEKEAPGAVATVTAVSGAAMLLKREMLLEVGLLDERYFLCFEDIDLCLRARQKGYLVLTVPAAKVRHKVSASLGGEGSTGVIYYAARNHLLVINRRLPRPLPFRCLRNFMVILYTLLFALVSARAPFGPALRAWARGTYDYFRRKWGEK